MSCLHHVVLPVRWWRRHCADVTHRRQMCKVCGRTQDEVDFIAKDRDFAEIVPARWHGLAVCLACFERFAAELDRPVVKVFLVNGP